ncbi:hypothetical protein TWF481_010675 [Arthrobotrys musiformis]|uniref:CCHC-type domain-containing protein n=1 Tax=Arthrobotrys musiformis TaxID=47236 RepID=A0AAV9W2U8_9PEZI
MEEPQPAADTGDDSATNPENSGLPAPTEAALRTIETIENDGQTRTDGGPPEIMDLTGDGDAPPTETIPGLPEPQSLEEQPVEQQPLEAQEVQDVPKEYVEASVQEEKGPKKRAYPDDGSSDSDDDSDMMDDSGITLNLQDDARDEDIEDEDEPQVITIDSSSDEESITKGRSKKQKAPEPFNGAAVERPDASRSNGAIAVSAGLKLGKSARSVVGVAKVTRRPLIESINAGQIEIVDYSIPGLGQAASTDAQALKGVSPTLPSKQPSKNGEIEVIDLLSDPVDPTDEATTADTKKPTRPVARDGADDYSDEGESASDGEDVGDEGDDDDDVNDEDGAVSDGESVSSVDTEIWSYQQKYYVRQPIPPLLHEDYRQLFTPDISGSAATQKALADIQSQEQAKKRKICDICMEPHPTEQCDKLRCDVCEASNSHFSFNCPYKSSNHKKVSDLPIFNVPVGQKDFEIWRIMPPQSRKPIKKASKIPMACYECGDDNHFGDDCPSFGKNRSSIPTTSIWNAKAASNWTTMNMDSKYIRNGKAKADTTNDDDDEPGWFEARLQAAKAAIPDSDVKRDYLEQHRYGAPSRPSGNPRPHIQMNLPRNLPGQDVRDDRGGPSFTRYQGPPPGGRFGDRAGGRNDQHYRPDHSRRERSRSPRRPSFSDRVSGYAQDRGNYRDRSQDFPRGQGHQPPHHGNQGYHAVPPPQQQQQAPQNYYGQQSGGWSLPGSVQRSVQSSNQPPLPPGPPPPLELPPPPPPHRRNSGRGGRGRGFFRGKRGGKH